MTATPRHAPTPEHLTIPDGWNDRTPFAPQTYTAMFTNVSDGWVASIIVRPDDEITWVITPDAGTSTDQRGQSGTAPDTSIAAQQANQARQHVASIQPLF